MKDNGRIYFFGENYFPKKALFSPFIEVEVLIYAVTQFQIKGEGLVQGVTKLITILFTFVALNKYYAN